jgi:asparagine synthase (glutamine-hydrolysing)
MVQWNTLLYLSAAHDLPADAPGVVMEGVKGELLGHHLAYRHITDPDTVVESQYQSEAARDVDTVRDLLSYEVDPFATLRTAARRSDEDSFVSAVVDVHFRNYYSRLALASNHLARSVVGTRAPYVDRELLEHVARLPLPYWMGSVPLTGGRIPYGVTVPKLRLVRALDTSLARIPYERTGVPPTWPLPLHVGGFVARTSLARLRGEVTYGGPSIADVWYRENETFRETVDDLIWAACDRPYFDADAIRRLRAAHLAGDGNHVGSLAAITTLESWFQQHLDEHPSRRGLTPSPVTD